MKLKTVSTKPFQAKIGEETKTVQQDLTTYKISTDKDMEELLEVMLTGIEIVSNIRVKDWAYVTVRKTVPLKIQVSRE